MNNQCFNEFVPFHKCRDLIGLLLRNSTIIRKIIKAPLPDRLYAPVFAEMAWHIST